MVRVHPGVATARCQAAILGGGPRTPRVVGDIDGQLLAPVAVDLRCRYPLPVDVARLHRVLCPVALHDGSRVGRVGGPAVGSSVLGRGSQLAQRNSCEVHRRRRMSAAEEAALADEILLEGVAEQVGEGAVVGYGVPVHRADAAVGCRVERQSLHGVGVVGRQPEPGGVPAEAVAWAGHVRVLGHLGPEHFHATAAGLRAHRPEPLTEWTLPVARFERRGLGSSSAVQHGEALAVLDQEQVVRKERLVQPGGGARRIHEGVLEEPCVPAATERDHVLVIGAHQWADASCKERIERVSPGAAGAAH